jgi:hypothetical protein
MPRIAQRAQHAAPQPLGRQLARRGRARRPAVRGAAHAEGSEHRDREHRAGARPCEHHARQRRPHGARAVEGHRHQRDGLRQLLAIDRVAHGRVPRGRLQRGAHAEQEGEEQQRARPDPAGQRQAREHRGRRGVHALDAQHQRAAVGGVGQHAGGQRQQEHRQEGGGLHQRRQERRGRELDHQPRGRHVLHGVAHEEQAAGRPQPAERTLLERAPDGRGGGCGGGGVGVQARGSVGGERESYRRGAPVACRAHCSARRAAPRCSAPPGRSSVFGPAGPVPRCSDLDAPGRHQLLRQRELLGEKGRQLLRPPARRLEAQL